MNIRHAKRPYTAPEVTGGAQVLLEKDLLIGSLFDWARPIETAGLENGGFYDYESDATFDSTFNHTWGE